MRYKIAIVEDDSFSVDKLKTYLNQYTREKNVDFDIFVFNDGDEITSNYEAIYDIIFLDIEMKRQDGMITAQKIRELDNDVIIIFIKNMSQYAIHGHAVDALSFLLKPVPYFAFSQELKKSLNRCNSRKTGYILVPSSRGIFKLSTKEILFVENVKHQLYIHTNDEALIGDERGDKTPYSGWYAPGVNLHRSPFGGRVGEYYSEDPLLSGKLASGLIKGVSSKGVYTFVKHLAVNEQETSRSGVATWLDEQTMRELYFKPFEYTVKEGKATGMMSSFNRTGTVWTGGDYRLLHDVLRSEWGFRGTVISDFNTGGHMDSRQMAYGGGDLNLQNFNQEWNARKSSASDLTVLRINTKNILYTVVNSNAMNSDVIAYKNPLWVNGLIIINVVVYATIIGTGAFFITRSFKKTKDDYEVVEE